MPSLDPMTPWVALLLVTPPPPPTPQAVREVPACAVELDLPRGAVVVTRICLVRQGRIECADDGMISVPERPAFAEKEARSAHGVRLGPVPLAVREERYENETRYRVRQSGQDPHVLPAVVTGAPLALEVESRDCPQEPLSRARHERGHLRGRQRGTRPRTADCDGRLAVGGPVAHGRARTNSLAKKARASYGRRTPNVLVLRSTFYVLRGRPSRSECSGRTYSLASRSALFRSLFLFVSATGSSVGKFAASVISDGAGGSSTPASVSAVAGT